MCGGFVGEPKNGDNKNYIKNSLFRPKTVSVSTSYKNTFTNITNDGYIENCYYFTQLGGAQGINANITSNNDILAGLGDSWKRMG